MNILSSRSGRIGGSPIRPVLVNARVNLTTQRHQT
jgi:hypothetical protein